MWRILLVGLLSLVFVVGNAVGKQKVPDDQVIRQLVKENMLDFAHAVNTKDFSGFYAKLSERFRDQTTAKKLATAFKAFSDNQIDLTPIQNHDAVFKKNPFINNKDLLIVEGKYELPTKVVPFNLKYIFEAPDWKLFGIHVKIRPVQAAKGSGVEIPPEPELKNLVHQTMLDFAAAVNAKDFSDFHRKIAKLWQEQITSEEFGRIFKSFIDQNVDLSPIEPLSPVFQKKPYLDGNGFLILQGIYNTEPLGTHFKLKYVPEETEWKLVGINIETKE
jgi:Ca2+-binding EF-hand superfamily protein